MFAMSILSTISCITYIYMGAFVLYLNHTSKSHRNLFYSCLAFSLWSFSYIFLNLDLTPADREFWQKMSFCGALVYVIFTFRFFLYLTRYNEKIKRKALVNALILIIPGFFLFENIAYNAIANSFPYGVWYITAHIYANSYNGFGLFLVFIWGRKSKRAMEKKQAKIIVRSAIAVIIITIISDYAMGFMHVPTLTPFLTVIWCYAIVYAMAKYRLLSITPQMVSKYIIDHIDEVIIFLNTDSTVAAINERTEEICGGGSLIGSHISSIVPEHEKVQDRMMLLLADHNRTFSASLLFGRNKENTRIMDAHFSVIRDKMGDSLGLLIIARELRELKHLRQIFKITLREIEIIHHIVTGTSNKEIALFLGISENTMKRHITNIYFKLNVNNKIGLMRLLDELNISHKNA